MSAKFDYFVILAAMRTGSNLLEAHLNQLDDIHCNGEAFNPHFIGRVKSTDLLGISLEQRDDDPQRLLGAIRRALGGLHGFRYFQDHDPRILTTVLDDPKCAKVILTRNPLDSYLSLKIVRKTKQWQLKNIKRRLAEHVEFEAAEFRDYLENLRAYTHRLHHRLQITGQSAFHINYDDLNQLDVLNGLAAWLGAASRLDRLDDTLKPQNPEPAFAKVTNPDEMQRSLSQIDCFGLHQTPDFEPARGPGIAQYVAAPHTPLLYLPTSGGLDACVTTWLADLDGCTAEELITGQTREQTNRWMLAHPGHRKFTVLRHPLARAHSAFCTYILNTGAQGYPDIRHLLRNRFKLPIPGQVRKNNYSLDQHYQAFAAFLRFLNHNLLGQTPIRVDASWCSQAHSLEGLSRFALPDLILREPDLALALPDLARKLGRSDPPDLHLNCSDEPFTLAQIYDARLESLAATAYARDYRQFGFDTWAPV